MPPGAGIRSISIPIRAARVKPEIGQLRIYMSLTDVNLFHIVTTLRCVLSSDTTVGRMQRPEDVEPTIQAPKRASGGVAL
jgi:hypothetical protein